MRHGGATRSSTLAAAALLLSCASAAHVVAGEFVCPDDRARRLYAMARDPGGGDIESRLRNYRYVIEQATRPMDDRALNIACGRLAHDLHRRKHASPEYADAVPPLTDLDELVAEEPALGRCPKYAINTDVWLPIRRVWVPPPRAVIDGAITGFVRLALVVDRRGDVEQARVRWSSHPMLEEIAIASAMQFRYRPRLDKDGAPVRTEGVLVTHRVDYWSLARIAGCELN